MQRIISTTLALALLIAGRSVADDNQRGVFVDASLGIRIRVPDFPASDERMVMLANFGGPASNGFAPHFGITVDRVSDRKTYLAESAVDEQRGAFKTFSQELLQLEPDVEAVLTDTVAVHEDQTMRSIDLAAFHRDHTFLVSGAVVGAGFGKFDREFESCVRSFRFIGGPDREAVSKLGWTSYYLNPTHGIAVRTPLYGTANDTPRIVASFSGGTIKPGQTTPCPGLQVVLHGYETPSTLLRETKQDSLAGGWRTLREELWTISGKEATALEVAFGPPKLGRIITWAAVSDGERTFVLRGVRALDERADRIGAEIEACMKSFVCRNH